MSGECVDTCWIIQIMITSFYWPCLAHLSDFRHSLWACHFSACAACTSLYKHGKAPKRFLHKHWWTWRLWLVSEYPCGAYNTHFGNFHFGQIPKQAPRSSPISFSGKNPQNRPQICNNLSLKSAILDKAVTCHSCDTAKYVEKENALGPHTGLRLGHVQSIQIYFCPQDIYKSAIIASALCFESPAFYLQLQQRHKYFSSATEFADMCSDEPCQLPAAVLQILSTSPMNIHSGSFCTTMY